MHAHVVFDVALNFSAVVQCECSLQRAAQDWWDGSAVDGWTLPFTVLVDDGGHGLRPGFKSSSNICGNVVQTLRDDD